LPGTAAKNLVVNNRFARKKDNNASLILNYNNRNLRRFISGFESTDLYKE